MITYVVYVEGEEGIFHTFQSAYSFTKKENIGDKLYVKKDGKIHAVTIQSLDIHDINEEKHIIRLYGRFNKLFS